LGFIQKKSVVKRLFDEIAPRFRDRQGEYSNEILANIGFATLTRTGELTGRRSAPH